MKTPEEILRQEKYRRLQNLVLICEAMDEYAQSKAREMVLEYARWYEENSVPEEHQNEDWMIQENVKSFYNVNL